MIIPLLRNMCSIVLNLDCLCKSLVFLHFDSPPTNSVIWTFLHIASLAWSRPCRRRGRRPLGIVAVLSSRHDAFNACLDVVPDALLHWRSVCSLATQSVTFCPFHPCSIALSIHQLHHQVFSIANLSALPVPHAKQVSSVRRWVEAMFIKKGYR